MPATAERVIAMAPIAFERAADIRDRALLLFGFASAMRRSELAALNFEDIEETADGLRVTIRRSKTDQEGHGDVIEVPRGTIACPVAALKAWLEAATITEGPVFRPIAKGERIADARLTDRSIATIVKAHAARVGLDPAAFAGHSLRSGFLTSAAARGASIFKMADQSRHKSMDTLRATSGTQTFSSAMQGRACCKRGRARMPLAGNPASESAFGEQRKWAVRQNRRTQSKVTRSGHPELASLFGYQRV
jgi:integrase